MTQRFFSLGPLGPVLLGLALGACGTNQPGPVDQSAAKATTDDGGGAPEPAAPDQGGPGRRGYERLLERFDRDDSGTLEVAELPPAVAKRLGQADADGNGTLTQDELRAHITERARERFDRQDTNGDGALSEQEVGPKWQRIAKADTNGSGSVSFEELQAAFESGKLGPMRKGPGRWHHHGGPGCGKKMGEKMFEKFDTDGDGVVQLTDIPERRRERIAEADQNGDGALSRDELDAHRAKKLTEHFSKKDGDGDGFITEGEAGRHWKFLSKADQNGDGKIDQNEFLQGHESGALCAPGMHGKWKKHGKGKRGRGERGRGGRGGPGEPRGRPRGPGGGAPSGAPGGAPPGR